jgi:hypothetical protein
MRISRSGSTSGRAVTVSLLLALALVAGAVVFAAAGRAVADAPRRQPRDTHIGQRLDDFVVLNMINPTTSPIFVRCHDDGTRDTAEFTVPTGSRMVVTDVDCFVKGNGYFNKNFLRLFVEKSSNRCLAMLRPADTMITDNGSQGISTTETTFASSGVVAGFVVGAGARVVADVITPNGTVTSNTLTAFSGTNAVVILRGYLVKDE